MFLFENGQFYIGGCSFILPDGFYLEEGYDKDKFILAKIPDKTATVMWQVTDDKKEVAAGLKILLDSDAELSYLSEIMPLTVNNLCGYHVFYKDGKTEIYETRFFLAKDQLLTFNVVTRGKSIFELVVSSMIQRTINGLHAV